MAKQYWKPGNMLYPVPAVMVSCKRAGERPNIITVAWAGTVCSDPAMVSVSVRPERYSYDIINETREFVLNLVTKELTFATDYCGVKSGRDVDKFREMKLTPFKSRYIEAPGISESPVNIECKVTEVIPLGTHHMFLAEVAGVTVDEAYMNENGKFELNGTGLVAYSHGEYFELGEKLGKFGYSVKRKSKPQEEMNLKKIAVVTDSNSGITQDQAKEEGVYVLPMPFFVDGETYFEDIDLTQEQFYEKLEGGAEISTSMPAIGDVTDLWDRLLAEYDEIVHIPMSSGLSGSCGAAVMIAQEYDGKVQVVNNQRISVTLKQSVRDAKTMADQGMSALKIKNYLEDTKFESSIYIMLDTLYYLKKGGRITPAVAALGTLLRLKPVLQIQGEKLDTFAKARTPKQGKKIMMEAIRSDLEKRFEDPKAKDMWIQIAYTKNREAALELREELLAIYPDHDIVVDPLSLSVSCHIGPGALAIACSKKLHI